MTAALAQLPTDAASLPRLVSRAAQKLAAASSSAEILDARDLAGVIYDAAKRAARMAQAKSAHDDVIAAAHRAQADALEIEAMAKRRLADEYDAAQERGELQKPGGDRKSINISAENNDAATLAEIGIKPKEVHEARQIRDAEEAQPGVVRQTLDRALADKREPTRAEVQRSVVAAAEQAMKRGPRKPRNPNYTPDPLFSRIAHFSSMCEQIASCDGDVAKFAAYSEIDSTRDRLHRNVGAAFETLRKFQEASHA